MFMILDEATAKRVLIAIFVMLSGAVIIQLLPRLTASESPLILPTSVPPTAVPMMTFVAPTLAPTVLSRELAPYPVYGPAAELRGDVWLNTGEPLRLADLRGEVALLLFWAFECPPCMPVLEHARAWHEAYAPAGLNVIGVHTPNLEVERDFDLLREALVRLEVPYPVVQDNELRVWQAYGQEIWPSVYLIDRRGYLRYRHVGAGGYAEIEAAIVALLAEAA